MDLSFLNYDLMEEVNNNDYSWKELLYGLNNNIISKEDVINYAIYILDEDILGFEIVLEITCLNNDDEILPFIVRLSDMEEPKCEDDIKEKWLYLILKWLYRIKNSYIDVLSIIEEIYELFGYPENIVSFVRYMPSDSGDLGSLELNRKRSLNNWKAYLREYE